MSERRYGRDIPISVALSIASFVLAWLIGRLAAHPSLTFAYLVAIFSDFFWMVSVGALFITDFLLYGINVTVTYVPPPLAAYVRPPAQLRMDVLISGVHCLITGITNLLLYRGVSRIPITMRRWVLAGACIGSLVGTVYLLPADVLPASAFGETTVRYATAFPNAVFAAARVTMAGRVDVICDARKRDLAKPRGR